MGIGVGSKARLAYGIEATFKGGGTASNPFGVGARLTGIGGRNNIERIYEIGNRAAAKLVAMRFEGTWGVEATLGNIGVFDTILSAGAIPNDPISLVVEVGFEGDENVLRTLKGAVVRRMTMSTRVNEPVRIRLDGLYATETVSTPLSITAAVPDANEPYTFAGASLTFDGQAVAEVQALDIDMTTGFDMEYALGDRAPAAAIARAFEVGGKFSATARSSSFVKYMLGLGSGTATEPSSSSAVTEVQLVATFTNGTNNITATIDGVAIDELGSAIEANEMILFDVTFTGRTISIATV